MIYCNYDPFRIVRYTPPVIKHKVLIDPNLILNQVCESLKILRRELLSPLRTRELSDARAIFAALINEFTNLTPADACRMICRDRTLWYSLLEKHQDLQTNKTYMAMYNTIYSDLREGGRRCLS